MFGGLMGGFRDLIDDGSPYAQFEKDVEELLGDRIRAAPESLGWNDRNNNATNDAVAFWSALANVDWFKDFDGKEVEVSYTFRAAGGLIAAIRKSGDYMDWYLSGPYSIVADWIAEAMATRGWRFEADGDQDSLYEVNVRTGDVKKHESLEALIEDAKGEQ